MATLHSSGIDTEAPLGTNTQVTMSPANLVQWESQRYGVQPVYPTQPMTPTWYTQNGPVRSEAMQAATAGPEWADENAGWPVLKANPTSAEVDDYIRTYYGYLGAFMAIPEVGNILRTAALQHYDKARLFGAIYATNWWKTTSANERQWTNLVAQDPGEANRQRQTKAASVDDMASQYGINLSPAVRTSLIEDSLKFGWDQKQIVDAVVSHAQFRQGQMQGMLASNMDNVRAMAAKYGLLMSEHTAYDWSVRVLNESLTVPGIESAMRQQAKARYSYLAPLIDQGVTVADYFEPVRNTVANELEMSPNAVNLLDNRYLRMLEVRDPKTGELRGATTSEAQTAARQDPRWKDTRNAGELAAGMIGMLDRAMGVH